MKYFLLGFESTIDDSPFLNTAKAYAAVGNNTGNLAFCYAASCVLGHGMQSTLWNTPADKINAMGDIGVLTLANQLGPHADMGYLTANFEKLTVGLVGLGLGAQGGLNQKEIEVPEGTLQWLRAIQKRSPNGAPNLGVRGEWSLQTLQRYGLGDRAAVIGCPTLFLNPDPQLGRRIAARLADGQLESIAVTAGHQRWAHLATLEASLVAMAEQSHGAYICQSPLEMVQLGRGGVDLLGQDERDMCRNYIAPWMTDAAFSAWSKRSAYSFFSAPAWMEYLRRFDCVVGTRIHGVMLALQAGVPALCFAHDSRTVELCETMKVPYVLTPQHSRGVTRDQLKSLIQFDAEEFDSNRRLRARNFAAFLRSNNLEPQKYLDNLAAPL